MNPNLKLLQPYPFEKLAGLLSDVAPNETLEAISLSVGEPKHAVPAVILDAYRNALEGIGQYPNTLGSEELRSAIAGWLTRRFDLPSASLDTQRHILPVNGTREALFAFAQAVIAGGTAAKVLMPNPCYQIYEGAAYLAGAEPHYLPCDAHHGFLPDLDSIDEATWRDCQLFYLCSPGNPTGAVMPLEQLQQLITFAHKYDFIIASDECYSEIYPDESAPPPGLLQAAATSGLDDYKRCVVFHSLSKRSNVPGMRSGFVAGDAEVLAEFRRYRTYHGSTMSPAVQKASIAAWSDEAHVQHNRELYRQKFSAFQEVLDGLLDCQQPEGSFYLWPSLPIDDCEFTRRALAEQHLRLVPGSYLSREVDGHNPGQNHIRLSLVAGVEACHEAALRIRNLLETL